MEKKSSLSIALSQEELFVTLAYLKAPYLLGLNNQVLTDLPQASRDMVMGVAERALIARGYLGIKKDTLELIPVVQAMIGACISPQKTLVIQSKSANQVEEDYYFHVSRKMNVMHMQPMTAIHQFTMVKDATMLPRSAFATMKLTEPKNLTPLTGVVPDSVVTQVQEAAKEGSQAKPQALLKTVPGLSADFVDAFCRSLNQAHRKMLVMCIRQQENKTPMVDGFTLLVGGIHLWLLQPGDNGNVNISTTQPKAIHEALVNIFAD